MGLPFFSPPSRAYLPWRCTRRSTRLKLHPAASLPRVPADRGARSQAASKATRRLLQGARAARSGDELPNLLVGCVGGGSTARGATLWDRTREGGPDCPAPRPPTHHHHTAAAGCCAGRNATGSPLRLRSGGGVQLGHSTRAGGVGRWGPPISCSLFAQGPRRPDSRRAPEQESRGPVAGKGGAGAHGASLASSPLVLAPVAVSGLAPQCGLAKLSQFTRKEM